MNDAKCPKCDAYVTNIKIKGRPAYNDSGTQFNGVVFTCPDCDAILGAGLDPVAVGHDVVEQVVSRLQRKR